MSKKNLNWKAYWRIMSRYGKSPLLDGCPSINVEEVSNWFSCNEEMHRKFTSINSNHLLS